MSNDLLSVVIVTFESENEIESCLNALLLDCRGGGIECDVWVIDNASGDRTCQKVEAWYRENEFANQLIQNSRNLGFTSALNQGLRNCNGDYILILNPDTVVREGCMRRLIDVLGSDHQTGVVAPQLRNPDGSLQPSCRRFPRRRDVTYECLGLNLLFPKSRLFNSWKMGDFDHLSQRRVEQPQGAFLLTTREVMNSVGLWDETYPMFFSDVEWCHRVKNAGLDIIFEPGARVMHQKGVSIYKRRAAMIWTSHISFYRYLKKYRAHGLGFIVNGLFGVFMVILALVRIGLSKLTTNSSKKNETR